MRALRPQPSGPRASKTKNSSPALRWLLVNSLGKVLQFDYQSATGYLGCWDGERVVMRMVRKL